MTRLPFVAMGLALCAAVTVCLAQQPPSTPKDSPAKAGSGLNPYYASPVAEAEAPPSKNADVESLRAELVDLIKQKSDLMTAEELNSALSQAQQELQELHGTRKLEHARQLLEQVTQEHPNTKAAQKAELILRDWDSGSRFTFPQSSTAPANQEGEPI
jgi:TolA-binding protein